MAAAVVVGLCGCTASQYAHQADKTASDTITQANRAALGKPEGIDITYRPLATQPSTMPTTAPAEIRIGAKRIALAGNAAPTPITLVEAIDIALRNSRDFQTQKEQLRPGLSVASTRRAWNWTQYGGAATGTVSRSVGGNVDSASAASASLAPTFVENFFDGGQLALGSGLNYASALTGWDNTSLGSLFSANFTQPLLQGAWRGFAYEPQYRAERDLLVAVFSYQRYIQTFAVNVATSYYTVLQQRDQLENERTNIKRLKQVRALAAALAEGGEDTALDRNQAEQNYINAQITLETYIQSYRTTHSTTSSSCWACRSRRGWNWTRASLRTSPRPVSSPSIWTRPGPSAWPTRCGRMCWSAAPPSGTPAATSRWPPTSSTRN